MSYILDAVKRAQAERERGTVPGVNARQITTSIYLQSPLPGGVPVWIGSAMLLAAGVVLAAWWWLRVPAAAPTGDTLTGARATADLPTTPMAAPTANLAASAKAEVSVAQNGLAPALPALTHDGPEAAPIAIRAMPEVPSRAVAPVQTPDPPKIAGKTPSGGTNATPVPTIGPISLPKGTDTGTSAATNPSKAPGVTLASANKVPMLTELPETIRRQIPALSINGAIFSESPRQWALLVNDQVLSPGGLAAPELTLEEISASSSVFNFRGTRFRVDY
jgi:general secretion pathway protein B